MLNCYDKLFKIVLSVALVDNCGGMLGLQYILSLRTTIDLVRIAQLVANQGPLSEGGSMFLEPRVDTGNTSG